MTRTARLVRIIARLTIAAVAAAGVFVAYAYWRYNRPAPTVHDCVDCNPATKVGDYRLYVRRIGTPSAKAPVVLVHGGPGHSSLSFKKSFDFLGASREVLYYDQRGSGNSESKSNAADYTVDHLVEELETIRRDVLKSDRIVVVGHSFGSAIAQRYALAYQSHVEKLVLVGGVRINNGIGSHLLWKVLGPAAYSTALGMPPGDGAAADHWFTHDANGDDTLRLYDKSKRAILEGTGNVGYAAWREISLSAAGSDYHDALTALQVPTLFMYGVADSPYTGKEAAEAICAEITHCTKVGFAHSGHWPFLEEPQAFQRALLDFLDR